MQKYDRQISASNQGDVIFQRGKHFDPDITDSFLTIEKEIMAMKRHNPDPEDTPPPLRALIDHGDTVGPEGDDLATPEPNDRVKPKP